ncbi:MAG: hypothetical protein ACRDWI_19470 [Jiangellaceae bacterium]
MNQANRLWRRSLASAAVAMLLITACGQGTGQNVQTEPASRTPAATPDANMSAYATERRSESPMPANGYPHGYDYGVDEPDQPIRPANGPLPH